MDQTKQDGSPEVVSPRSDTAVDGVNNKGNNPDKKVNMGDQTAEEPGKEEESGGSIIHSKAAFRQAGRYLPGCLVSVERHFYTQDHLEDMFPHPPDTASARDLIRNWCRTRCSGTYVGSYLLGFLPVVRVLRFYSWGSWLFMDIISGLSVGFLHLPQALGFGLLAELSPVHGLYTSVFPVLVYMLFGTSPHVSMGTNAVVALLSASIVDKEMRFYTPPPDLGEGGGRDNGTVSAAADLLKYKVGVSTTAALLEGVILIGMGLLRMGFLTNYMSNSFIGGFSFAAAVHITVSQVVKLFHLKVPSRSGPGKLVLTTIDVVKNIKDTNVGDIVVGVICGAILLGINSGINQRYKHRLKVPIPAELLVVILSTLVSHFAQLNERFNVDVVGDIPRGMPAPTVPPMENVVRILPQVFVDAILIFVLTITLAKLTAKLHDINIDDNQELVAYGLCQVVGAFFQNFSSSISPPRTMMLSSMGSKSTLNGLSTTVFLLVVLLAAGPLFVSLPIAMLAVMIIVAMKDLLLQLGKLKHLWYVNKGDFFIWTLTVLFSVLGDLDLGLLAGTLSSMVMVLAYSQLAKGVLLGKAPNEELYLDTDRQGVHSMPGLRIFRFESQLHFASAERFKSEIYRKVFDPTNVTRKDHYEIDVTFRPGRQSAQSFHSIHVEAPSLPGQEMDRTSPSSQHKDNPQQASGNVDKPSPATKSRRSSFTGQSVAAPAQETGPEDTSQNNNTEVQPVTSCQHQEEEAGDIKYVILDCSTMTYVDLTGVEMLHLIITQFARAGVTILLTDIPPTTMAILHRVNFFVHEDYNKVYYNVLDAVHYIRTLKANKTFRKSFS